MGKQWIVPDVILVGYGRTQVIQIKCLHCGTQFFPDNKCLPVCEICEHENWKPLIKEWRMLESVNTLNVIGWEQRVAIQGTRKERTHKNYIKVYKRDNYTCQYCGYQITFNNIVALQIDHVNPFVHGGSNSEKNLVVSCKECNLIASSRCFSNFIMKKFYIQDRRKQLRWVIYRYDLCPFPDLEREIMT